MKLLPLPNPRAYYLIVAEPEDGDAMYEWSRFSEVIVRRVEELRAAGVPTRVEMHMADSVRD